MSGARRFQKQLKDFISSNVDFKIIHNSSPNLVSQTLKRLCVLDSSFNPPHLGHCHLVEKALSYDYGSSESVGERSVLLLLSVKNADKINPVPESFETRLEMMYLMTTYLRNTYNVDVSIGLTKHAKFVDKSMAISNYLKSSGLATPDRQVKLTFLVGFDTLIRVFDPKYYLPDKLSNSLESFIKTTDLFCLTRDSDKISLDEQMGYVTEIDSGKYDHIPSSWSKSIYLTESLGDNVSLISSSELRSSIKNDATSWYSKVIPGIKAFIISEKLYKEEFH